MTYDPNDPKSQPPAPASSSSSTGRMTASDITAAELRGASQQEIQQIGKSIIYQDDPQYWSNPNDPRYSTYSSPVAAPRPQIGQWQVVPKDSVPPPAPVPFVQQSAAPAFQPVGYDQSSPVISTFKPVGVPEYTGQTFTEKWSPYIKDGEFHEEYEGQYEQYQREYESATQSLKPYERVTEKGEVYYDEAAAIAGGVSSYTLSVVGYDPTHIRGAMYASMFYREGDDPRTPEIESGYVDWRAAEEVSGVGPVQLSQAWMGIRRPLDKETYAAMYADAPEKTEAMFYDTGMGRPMYMSGIDPLTGTISPTLSLSGLTRTYGQGAGIISGELQPSYHRIPSWAQPVVRPVADTAFKVTSSPVGGFLVEAASMGMMTVPKYWEQHGAASWWAVPATIGVMGAAAGAGTVVARGLAWTAPKVAGAVSSKVLAPAAARFPRAYAVGKGAYGVATFPARATVWTATKVVKPAVFGKYSPVMGKYSPQGWAVRATGRRVTQMALPIESRLVTIPRVGSFGGKVGWWRPPEFFGASAGGKASPVVSKTFFRQSAGRTAGKPVEPVRQPISPKMGQQATGKSPVTQKPVSPDDAFEALWGKPTAVGRGVKAQKPSPKPKAEKGELYDADVSLKGTGNQTRITPEQTKQAEARGLAYREGTVVEDVHGVRYVKQHGYWRPLDKAGNPLPAGDAVTSNSGANLVARSKVVSGGSPISRQAAGVAAPKVPVDKMPVSPMPKTPVLPEVAQLNTRIKSYEDVIKRLTAKVKAGTATSGDKANLVSNIKGLEAAKKAKSAIERATSQSPIEKAVQQTKGQAAGKQSVELPFTGGDMPYQPVFKPVTASKPFEVGAKGYQPLEGSKFEGLVGQAPAPSGLTITIKPTAVFQPPMPKSAPTTGGQVNLGLTTTKIDPTGGQLGGKVVSPIMKSSKVILPSKQEQARRAKQMLINWARADAILYEGTGPVFSSGGRGVATKPHPTTGAGVSVPTQQQQWILAPEKAREKLLADMITPEKAAGVQPRTIPAIVTSPTEIPASYPSAVPVTFPATVVSPATQVYPVTQPMPATYSQPVPMVAPMATPKPMISPRPAVVPFVVPMPITAMAPVVVPVTPIKPVPPTRWVPPPIVPIPIGFGGGGAGDGVHTGMPTRDFLPLGIWQVEGLEVYGPNPLLGLSGEEIVGGKIGRRRLKHGRVYTSGKIKASRIDGNIAISAGSRSYKNTLAM